MLHLMTNILIAIVALLHVWFLILEMFLWTKPLGLKTFRTTQTFANEAAALAANQGLYNGFLAAGLIWGILLGDAPHAAQVKLFFLGCVAIAGIYGAATVSSRILFMQALPAILAGILVYSGR